MLTFIKYPLHILTDDVNPEFQGFEIGGTIILIQDPMCLALLSVCW